MTGARVKELRELLALDPFAMAAMLGVHVSTVYRWEHARTARQPVRFDLLQRLVMAELDTYAAVRPECMIGLGHLVKNALVHGGSLHGLRELLTHLVPRP